VIVSQTGQGSSQACINSLIVGTPRSIVLARRMILPFCKMLRRECCAAFPYESAMPDESSTGVPGAGASIWLLPSAADATFFDSIISDLSARFGSPLFWSHLTLAGDLAEGPEKYVDVLERLASSCRSFAQPIEEIALTDIYFRSFYARFARSPDLDGLQKICVDSVGGSTSGFLPHVSLLYGSVPEPGKSEAAADLRRAIKGRVVTFDRVVVTNSSDTTPIYEWRIHAAKDLRRV
jgi:hypothetical protein